MASVTMTGPWSTLGGILAKGAQATRWRSATSKALLKEGHRLRAKMVKAFNQGGPQGRKWAQLSPTTIAIRKAMGFGGRKPLLRTGDLRNSITVVQPDADSVFVGFHRNAVTSDGKQVVPIASIHENGAIFTVPADAESSKGKRVRGFWYAMSVASGGAIKPLKKSTTILVIKIPPRPLIRPIWEQERNDSAKRILGDTLRGIGWSKEAGILGL